MKVLSVVVSCFKKDGHSCHIEYYPPWGALAAPRVPAAKVVHRSWGQLLTHSVMLDHLWDSKRAVCK